MGKAKDPTIWIPNDKARDFFNDLDRWLKDTGTNFKCLAEAAGVSVGVKGSVVRHGCSMRIEAADKLIAAKNAHPNGIRPPKRAKPTGRPVKAVIDPPTAVFINEADLERRREEVRREREQRAMWHLQSERPGINGKRAGSMRPVWEMPA